MEASWVSSKDSWDRKHVLTVSFLKYPQSMYVLQSIIFVGSYMSSKSTVAVVVQSFSCVQLFATPWTAARQASLSITNSRSLFKLISIESIMPPNHLILCCPFSSCLQSFPASGCFLMSQLLHQVPKVLELQLQHQSFNLQLGKNIFP